MEMHSEVQEEMLRYWIWLSLVFGAGSTKLLQYLQRTDSPKDVYDLMQAGRLRDLPPSVRKAMTEHTLHEADNLVYYCRKTGVELLTIDSATYPQMLRNIGTPPVLLTAKGNLELLRNPLSLSVVGTRRPSPYTERLTAWIIGALAKQEFTIISGFARGVDAVAHTAALDHGGSTVAVLGCGINVNYPHENQVLRERMLSGNHGLFLSEYLPGTQPLPAHFPKRNRILSGLGYAVAVMEAAERSGSLVTAQCANDQGRYLYCVPPADLFDPRYAGVVPLLRHCAYPLMSPEDILMSYYSHFPQYLAMQEPEIRSSGRLNFSDDSTPAAAPSGADLIRPTGSFQEEVRRAAHEYLAEKAETQPVSAQNTAEQPLPEDDDGRAIVAFLRQNGDTYADDIALALDMDLSQLLSALTMLELDGFVESLFGKCYRAI